MRWYSARVPQPTPAQRSTPPIWPILIRISSIFVFALGTLVVLDILGIPITPLLARSGHRRAWAVALCNQPPPSPASSPETYVVAEGNISEGDYVEIDAERAGLRHEHRMAQHSPSQQVQQHDRRPQ